MNEAKKSALTSSAACLSSKQPATTTPRTSASAHPSIPASTPSYKSFSLEKSDIRCPKTRRAKEYEQHLLILRDMFPEYTDGLEEQLAYARSQQTRTKASDRERISAILEKYEMLTCREISEDLEMPYATVYKILRGCLERGLVAAFERKGIAGNKPYLVYSLPH